MAECSDSHSFHRRPGLTRETGFITITRAVTADQASRSPQLGGYCPPVGGDRLLPWGGEEALRELGEQHLIPAEVLHNRPPDGDGRHVFLPLPYPFPSYYPYSNHHLYYPPSVGWSGQIADRSIVAAAESRSEAEHICISVPHRGTPKYSTRRRHTGNRISRRRSLSHSSMASALSGGDRYQVPHAARHQQIGVSPSPSCITMGALEQNNYGTLRRYPAECVRISLRHPGFEENIPRILVIPRGPKGFGFILRGANPTQDVNFNEPTPEIPALQFFEGVDMTGPAMQAGLRPGDFLLAINGVDVRCASHEQVVDLIHQSGDTISLKVITVNPQAALNPSSQSHYATGYGTLMRRRNSSASVRTEGGGLPPLPPQRHPTTSLSFGRGAPFSNDETDSSTTDYQPLPLPPPSQQQVNYTSLTSAAPLAHPHSHHHHHQQLISEGTQMEEIGGGSGLINHVHNPSLHQQQHADYSVRCASVKARPSAARRISAAELEHLMIRQSASGGGSGVSGVGPSQFQPIQIQSSESTPHMSAAAVANGGPKKLAELKRKKQRGCASNAPMNVPSSPAAAPPGSKPFPLKSFNSSPELLQYPPPNPNPHSRQPSTDSNGNYSRPFRPTLRPKTPPPPPPAYTPTTNEHVPLSSSSVGFSANALPPAPPPPPPPPNLLKQPQMAHYECADSAVAKSASALAIADPKAADCRGISADALQSVRLKPTKTVVKGVDLKATFGNSNTSPQRLTEPNAAKASSSSTKKPADFDTDLRSALARRRSKVCADEEASSSGNTSSGDDKDSKGQMKSRAPVPGATPAPQTTNATNQPSSIGSASSSTTGSQPSGSAAQMAAATVGRYGGLSLRESVRENVQPIGGANNSQPHHSPPSGFVINKKDSGYTSSRTSLEPSECGDDTHQNPHHHQQVSANMLGAKNSSSSSANTLVEEAGPTTIRVPVDDSMNSAGATPTATSPPSPTRGSSELLLSAGAQAHRVTLISKQLEDSYGTDRRVVMAAGKGGGVSAFKVVAVSSEQSRETTPRPLFLEDPTRTPAVDYEDKADSGHGDSDQDGTASGSIQIDETGNASSATTGSNLFMTKKLVQWSAVDVAEWLCHLQLHDYVASFSSNQVTGKELAAFDRAKFTQLGVTRISHRQTMEQSLQRDYA